MSAFEQGFGAGERRPLLETVVCNLCGSADVHVLLPASNLAGSQDTSDLTTTFSSSSDERLRHQLVMCPCCGLQYVNPRLRAEAVLEGYSSGSDEQFVSQVRGRELTFQKSLEVIERVWNRPPGRLLDIGAGGGSFPFVASQRGWLAEGCEPNRWLCEWAREHYGMDLRHGTVFDQQYPPDTFDVVSLWDVLEHTSDPKTQIGEVHRLLRNDGLLVVNYPDIGSWIARVMGRSWVFLLDVHLYYFTRATIAKLLDEGGFAVVCMRPHYQRLSLGYILNRAVRYVGGPARMAQGLARKLGIAQWQVPYWMGQTLVIARKRAPSS